MATPGSSFAIESVAAKLVPFDLGASQNTSALQTGYNTQNLGAVGAQSGSSVITSLLNPSGSTQIDPSGPLGPILQTGGLVFPYTPTISETLGIKYDSTEIIHSNEAYYAYRSTDNVRIELTNCIWTCDTLQNAQYALAALHFFRSYSMMDFGKGRTGKPPSPMWFSAYGQYAFQNVPCLLERVSSHTWPADIDMVGIPNPGTGSTQLLTGTPGESSQYTWLPIKFEIPSISLIVQHTPNFWLNSNLDSYKSGSGLSNRQGIAQLPPLNPGAFNSTTVPFSAPSTTSDQFGGV